MRYAKIRKMDISNGEGVRVSIFVQGCTFNCKNCFNPETHDFNGGKEFTSKTLSTLMNLCNNDNVVGLSILGGEPLHDKNLDGVLEIVKTFRKLYPNKTIWIWTGFQFENAIKDKKRKEIIKNINVLVDGQYIDELHDFKLKWKGSSNQRVIDCQKSITSHQIILYE